MILQRSAINHPGNTIEVSGGGEGKSAEKDEPHANLVPFAKSGAVIYMGLGDPQSPKSGSRRRTSAKNSVGAAVPVEAQQSRPKAKVARFLQQVRVKIMPTIIISFVVIYWIMALVNYGDGGINA